MPYALRSNEANIDVAFFDGYELGDITFEGVTLKVTLSVGGFLVVGLEADSDEKFTQVNREYWYEVAIEGILDGYINLVSATGDPVEVVESDE